MARSDMPTLDTDAFAPATPAARDRHAVERAEAARQAGLEGTGAGKTRRAAVEYCVDNDLI